jgi:hypothetical protein
MPTGLGTGLLAASVVALAILAPTVPDEPFHLSGVMVVTGLVLAVFAMAVGLAQSAGANDAGAQSEGKWVAAVAGLAILVTLGVLVARVMAQVS